MATTEQIAHPARQPITGGPPSDPLPKSRRGRKRLAAGLLMIAAVGAVMFFGWRVYRTVRMGEGNDIPTAQVQRGDLTLNITASGELRGGNPQTLTAPMTGGTEMHITQLRKTGEEVKKGDMVVQFDTAEQQFKLKEAEADLAEAEHSLEIVRLEKE